VGSEWREIFGRRAETDADGMQGPVADKPSSKSPTPTKAINSLPPSSVLFHPPITPLGVLFTRSPNVSAYPDQLRTPKRSRASSARSRSKPDSSTSTQLKATTTSKARPGTSATTTLTASCSSLPS
jgi:hypothetical protein